MKSTLSVLFLALGIVSSPAATVAIWDFTGALGDQVFTAGTESSPALSAASNFTRGSGVTSSAAADSISAVGWSTGTVDLDDYFQFGVTIAAGQSITLNSIFFAERRSGTGIRDFEVRSSLDSFGAAISGTSTNVPDNTGTRSQSFALPAAFANLTDATGTVTFRIYGYTAEGAAGTWRIANHATLGGAGIDGTVVPEPMSALLVGLGSFALLLTRRRKS